MRLIDAHTHVIPHYAELAIKVMDSCGIEKSVTLEWHDGFGETLKEHLAVFNRYPGRFTVFGNVDWRLINEHGFAVNAAMQMERDVEAGMKGIKVYKALGLEYRDTDGNLWRIDDERLSPIWAKAGELEIPVLIHVADPPAFWQPVTESNFWGKVLHGEYAWWSYYRKGLPSKDELLAERNVMIRRHSETTFICPHMGSNSENLIAAADDLDEMPNLYYDISARIPIMGLPGRHAENSRQFLIEYADRVLFGTDSIYDDTNVPTGVQAQCLYQPFELPLGDINPHDKYISTSVEFIRSHIDFLTTEKIQENPPFVRSIRDYSIVGLGLPDEVLDKIFYKNAETIIK